MPCHQVSSLASQARRAGHRAGAGLTRDVCRKLHLQAGITCRQLYMHVPMEHFDYMITGNEQRRIYIESDDELSYSSIVVKAKASPMLLIHSLLITPHTKPHRECRPVITLLPMLYRYTRVYQVSQKTLNLSLRQEIPHAWARTRATWTKGRGPHSLALMRRPRLAALTLRPSMPNLWARLDRRGGSLRWCL